MHGLRRRARLARRVVEALDESVALQAAERATGTGAKGRGAFGAPRDHGGRTSGRGRRLEHVVDMDQHMLLLLRESWHRVLPPPMLGTTTSGDQAGRGAWQALLGRRSAAGAALADPVAGHRGALERSWASSGTTATLPARSMPP